MPSCASKKLLILLRLLPVVILSVVGISACSGEPTSTPALDEVPRYTFEVVAAYPHDRGAYTQGLAHEDGFLYEGTGLRGESSLRKVELESGEIKQLLELGPEFFGEGIAILNDRIFQLTLHSGRGFVYDQQDFGLLDEFAFIPQGWGLTHDGKNLIMSDGTSALRFIDPNSFEETGRLTVTDRGTPVVWLNELEWVDGEIFANIWQSDEIARISPVTGEVLGWIDLAPLRESRSFSGVLNGIAFDAEHNRLFVTGKNWPELFEIRIVEN